MKTAEPEVGGGDPQESSTIQKTGQLKLINTFKSY